MKLETSVKVYFDDVQGMVNEVKRLQTYKLFEGDDMVLVDLDAVVAIMANHVKADKCSEIPNGWIPFTPETMPEEAGTYLCTCADAGRLIVTLAKWQPRMKSWNLAGARTYWKVVAWMPPPAPYQPKEESE